MHRHWCMLLILYAVNAATYNGCHLATACPWEEPLSVKAFYVASMNVHVNTHYCRMQTHMLQWYMLPTLPSLWHSSSLRSRWNLRLCNSLLGTFRLQGVTSVNGAKWLCGVTLHFWQNGNDHLFTDVTDVTASYLKYYRKISDPRCVFNHQRVTNRTRQCSYLCWTKLLVVVVCSFSIEHSGKLAMMLLYLAAGA